MTGRMYNFFLLYTWFPTKITHIDQTIIRPRCTWNYFENQCSICVVHTIQTLVRTVYRHTSPTTTQINVYAADSKFPGTVKYMSTWGRLSLVPIVVKWDQSRYCQIMCIYYIHTYSSQWQCFVDVYVLSNIVSTGFRAPGKWEASVPCSMSRFRLTPLACQAGQ